MMIKAEKPVKGSKILMLGITFKENCPDIRNTRAIDIHKELTDFGIEVTIYDPWAKPEEVMHEYGVSILSEFPESNGYTAIILAVAQKEFLTLNLSSQKIHRHPHLRRQRHPPRKHHRRAVIKRIP